MKPILSVMFIFVGLVSAQFQFFEHLFNQGGQQAQQAQEKQNVPSDSSWYQQNWDGGEFSVYSSGLLSFPKHLRKLLGNVSLLA